MDLASVIHRLPTPLLDGVIGAVNNVAPLRRFVSKRTINGYAYKTPPRPRAVSRAADYTTWPGLTDRRYSDRHLKRAADGDAPAQPDMEEVVNQRRDLAGAAAQRRQPKRRVQGGSAHRPCARRTAR